MVTLGEKYTDKITGYTGIATGRLVHLTECVRVLLEAPAVKGETKDAWFDEIRLVDSAGKEVVPKLKKKPAGSRSVPPSRDPGR